MILFRLEEVEGGEEPVAAEQETWEGDVPQEGGRTGTMAVAKPRARLIEEPPRTAPAPKAGKRRRRVPVGVIAFLVVLLIVGAGLWTASRAVYFVGVDDQGAVTVYQGLPYELPFGLELYDRFYTSGVTLAQVAEDRRATFTDHKLRSKDDAEDLVRQARAGRGPVSARNRELLALVPASLLLTAGFAAIFIQESEVLSDISLTYGAWFLGLCFAGHLFLRFTLPHADPYMFPLVAVLACFGLVVIYRIDEDLARQQATWFVFGLLLFALTILLLRDLRVLERYRYTIALAGLVLLFLPRVPGIGQQVNGAYLGVGIGPVSFQPAEFGKIAIIVFLAAYLRDTRQVLVQGSRRFLFVTIPPTKHFGPLLVVWGAAMVMLVFIRDLGSSVMYFGGFLALLYVATNRLSFVAIGMVMFAAGAWFFASTVSHVQERVDIWLDPFKPEWVERQGYQIAQSLFAQADGGLFGTGLGASLLNAPDGNSLIPAPHTDLIYAVITSELGLVGACGLVLVYMMFVERGFRTAMLAPDSFSKLLAAGLSAVFALQVFVIVGGVTKVIPLTGVTLPFVSYGGSSILANFVLLALLLLVSDHARRPDGAMGRRGLR